MENIAVLRRIFTVFGIALIVTGLLIYYYRASFEKFNKNSGMLVHTLTIQEKIEELMSMIKDTEAGTRGYVVTNDSTFLKPFLDAKDEVGGKLDDLRQLCSENPVQSAYLDSLDATIEKELGTQYFIVHLKQSGNFRFGYLELMKESNAYMDTIRTFALKMKAEQNRLRDLQNEEVTTSVRYSRILSTIFSITAISIMVISLVSVLMEIRSKRRVKDLLNTVLESSQSGIMSFSAVRDMNGNIIDFKFIQANKVSAEMLDRSDSGLIDNSFSDAFPGSREDGFFNSCMEVAEQNIVFRTEKFLKREKGDMWLLIVAVKLEDGFTLTVDDITKEKGYETELQRNIEDLKRSNNELEQFAFVASHDLQEPLRKIQTYGERLKINSSLELSDNSRVFVDKMLMASRRMSNLISDLLSYSRLARNNESPVKINLNDVVIDVKNDLELAVQSKHAIIKVDELPTIEGIPAQLYQLFFNLIGNALKFSREGLSPEIKIHSEVISRKNDRITKRKEAFVRITVSDNGIGFENQYSDRIFEIFQRLHGKSEFEGTGIGLAICKRIVANHHGTIQAIGEPGQGSEFILELPVLQN